MVRRSTLWTVSGTVLGGLAAASVVLADDWSAEKQYPEYAKSKALCRAVASQRIPDADRPAAAVLPSLKRCDPEALYYGIGRPADPVKARLCAISQKPDSDEDDPYSAQAILIAIYANGVGVPRNLDLATHLACTLDGSTPAEFDGRVLHLQAMKGQPAPKRYEPCDDVTSGFHGGGCEEHLARIKGVKRDAEFVRLTGGLGPAQQAALTKLQAAQKVFAEARSTGEQDLSGTLRGAFVTEEMELQADDFVQMLRLLGSGKAPRYTAAQAKAADAELNLEYQTALMKAPKEADIGGGVEQDGIRKAQRAWLGYRDAWLAFAKARYPDLPPESLACWLTKKRSAMLRHLVNDVAS